MPQPQSAADNCSNIFMSQRKFNDKKCSTLSNFNFLSKLQIGTLTKKAQKLTARFLPYS